MDVETYRSLVLVVAVAAMSVPGAIWIAWTGRRMADHYRAITVAVVDRGIARRGR